MEPVRVILAASFFAMAAVAFFVFTDPGRVEGVTVSGAELAPMGDGFALTAKISNTGGPDVLTGIASENAGQAALTGGAATLAIPAGSSPSLAADGVHGMLTGVMGDTAEGRLVPVSLWFEAAGKISTRARIVGAAAIDHDAVYEVPQGAPRPALSLVVAAQQDGWRITLSVTGFAFSQEAADGPHQPGTGHGHLYLNGLKLQRVYGPEVTLGALPKGHHQLRVTLNTNDHRAYSVDGRPVSAMAEIVVD